MWTLRKRPVQGLFSVRATSSLVRRLFFQPESSFQLLLISFAAHILFWPRSMASQVQIIKFRTLLRDRCHSRRFRSAHLVSLWAVRFSTVTASQLHIDLMLCPFEKTRCPGFSFTIQAFLHVGLQWYCYCTDFIEWVSRGQVDNNNNILLSASMRWINLVIPNYVMLVIPLSCTSTRGTCSLQAS